MEDVYNMREERGGIVDGNIRNLVRNRILSGQLQNTEANLPFYHNAWNNRLIQIVYYLSFM
jgi:hypothetical protein